MDQGRIKGGRRGLLPLAPLFKGAPEGNRKIKYLRKEGDDSDPKIGTTWYNCRGVGGGGGRRNPKIPLVPSLTLLNLALE
jgi:hypothetical protein